MSQQAVPYKRKISISALTDTGRVRTHNEDNFIVCTDLDNNSWVLTEGWIDLSNKGCLLVLADGMGGANAGEIASSMAVEAIKESFSALTPSLVEPESARKEFLLTAILKAHDKILAKSKSDQRFEGMGTTVVIVWVIQNKLYVCWCGDSRAYKYETEKGLRLMTKDHSLVWGLVEAGRLTPDEADVHPDNNIITQSLGDPANLPKPDIVVEDLEAGDKILLCSDGLNNMVDSKTIENELRSESPPTQITKRLIQLANAQGGKDNITVILLQTLTPDSGPKKIPEKKRQALTVVGRVGLIVVILIFISFIWQSNVSKNTSEVTKTILPHMADSVVTESKSKKPTEPKVRRKVIDYSSAKTKDSLTSISTTEGLDPDSLEYIGSRIKNLHLLMDTWDSLKTVIDSLQKHARNLDGNELLRLDMLRQEFERFVAAQHVQRLFYEWNNFQNHPDSIGLSHGFAIPDLDRKIEEGNKILRKVVESLKNVKWKKEPELD